MKSSNYKPQLTTDPEYIKKIQDSTTKRAFFDIRFEILTDFFHHLGLENPYDYVNLESLESEHLKNLIDDSFQLINGNNQDIKTKLELIRDYLCEADPAEKSNIVMGFGGGGEARYQKCIELYKSGYAEKILFSGNIPYGASENQQTEYDYFFIKARSEGINEHDIILEKNARNTIENVVFSIKLLKESNLLPNKITLVNLPFTMRRSYYTLLANIDRDCTIIRQIARGKYNKENRFTTIDGYKFVLYEYIKMYGARLMGHI